MSSMQSYVRGNPARQAAAANAKIPMKKTAVTQHSQVQSNIPTLEAGNTQNSSASMQQHAQHYDQQNLQHPQSDHGQKFDAYDTDAESLDTTVNPSDLQVENNQQGQQQYLQPAHVDLGSEDVGSESFEDEEEEDKEIDVEISDEGLQVLRENGLGEEDHQAQVDFLDRSYPRLLRTLDGDSYPSTTDGNPNEEADQEEWGVGPVSPSPQRPVTSGPLMQTAELQHVHQTTNALGIDQVMHKQPNVFQKSANLRNRQQFNTHVPQRESRNQQRLATPPPTSQPPAYNPTTRKVTYEGVPHVKSTVHQIDHAKVDRPDQRALQHPQGPVHGQFQHSGHVRLPVTNKHSAPANIKMNPPVQQPYIEQAYAEDFHSDPLDYDHETLVGMSYDQLKIESFDNDPRAGPSVLSDDMDQRSLVERLEFVQKNLDAGKQSSFFSRLPTTEWEDSGDWFLDQFSSIVNRTKEARQVKRKFAREFEDEIEKRHRYVSNKQHQVEEAMHQMKTQGEGLVRSPRPKRG